MKTKFKVNNKIKGFARTDTNTRLIEINKKRNKKSKVRGELIDSLKHETVHLAHPRMSEKNVRSYTERVLKRMSQKSKNKLYSRLK